MALVSESKRVDGHEALVEPQTSIACRDITATETMALRHSVLWPQLAPEAVKLPEDEHGRHLGAFSTDSLRPVAVISLFEEPLPSDPGPTASASMNRTLGRAVRFRKFACEIGKQGHGIGSTLLNHTMTIARTDMGAGVLWCDARLETAGWYERRGMERIGSIFRKSGVEYVRMKVTVC